MKPSRPTSSTTYEIHQIMPAERGTLAILRIDPAEGDPGGKVAFQRIPVIAWGLWTATERQNGKVVSTRRESGPMFMAQGALEPCVMTQNFHGVRIGKYWASVDADGWDDDSDEWEPEDSPFGR